MTEKPSFNEEVAKQLTLPPDAVRVAREDWKRNQVMHAVLKRKLQERIDERSRGFRTITPDDLRSLQSEISALEYARDSINT